MSRLEELDLRGIYLRRHIDELRELEALCESPIELLLLWGFLSTTSGNRIHGEDDGRPSCSFLIPSRRNLSCLLIPQRRVAIDDRELRVDFELRLLGTFDYQKLPKIRIAVECDGHEFHERTADQAQRDKSRERLLVAAGFHVVRFTGSEIHRDPCHCANEVWRAVESLAEARLAELEGATCVSER